MQFSKLFVLAALFAAVEINAVTIEAADFNGADEDEIMDKVFSKYSIEGKDHNGVKNGQKILMKQTAPKAAGVILEATHKLKSAQVPGYIKANFEKAWDRFDINQDGFIRAEETHTFMRSLMGKLNKFALAPGSLSDIGGVSTPSAESKDEEKKPAAKKTAAKKKVVVKKKAAPKKKEEDEEAAEEPKEEEKKEEAPAEEPASEDAVQTDDSTTE
jgi:hypothetical protein